LQLKFWGIRICQIPNIRLVKHSIRHLLESKNSIGDSCLNGTFRMPGNFWNASFCIFWLISWNIILQINRILKKHKCFGAEIFDLMLTLLIEKIFLEKVNLVVLVDAFLDGAAEFFDSVGERRVFFYLFLMFIGVLDFRWINALRPLEENICFIGCLLLLLCGTCLCRQCSLFLYSQNAHCTQQYCLNRWNWDSWKGTSTTLETSGNSHNA
jgi:hypothetical protein